MTVLSKTLAKILPFASALALLGLAIPMAHAQAAKSTGASSLTKSASLASNPGGSAKWVCLSRQTVELAPVSSDVRSQDEAWLVVYRDKGEVVAAQRVSESDAAQIRKMPCGETGPAIG
jgi:hypothetical protein